MKQTVKRSFASNPPTSNFDESAIFWAKDKYLVSTGFGAGAGAAFSCFPAAICSRSPPLCWLLTKMQMVSLL